MRMHDRRIARRQMVGLMIGMGMERLAVASNAMALKVAATKRSFLRCFREMKLSFGPSPSLIEYELLSPRQSLP